MHLCKCAPSQFVTEVYLDVYIYMVSKKMQVCIEEDFTVQVHRYCSGLFLIHRRCNITRLLLQDSY
jgi:hypothetical protein